jgi:hypothetical protein
MLEMNTVYRLQEPINQPCTVSRFVPPSESSISIRMIGEVAMAITMYDQIVFNLACQHGVVLGRLDGRETWICEECGKVTGLIEEPYRSTLQKDRDTAQQLNAQEREHGEKVVRF